ncbi:folylpolyglutamate synthase, mitochondrial-like isoform X2 [Aricia agestis]|nr:folylpolyglutamate synthase, mitochondrial-like isoform X2 [Aricia agestis]
MENYLLRTGITLPMLDKLSVIHVAGTKGKGSTSAMCESILRAHGFRTGFYSSPHLVAVRERVRLCGTPIHEHMFAQYFHEVYEALYNTQRFKDDMPKYFAFLTVLAFHVFLREKVDVAVVEVGIGGIVDYTNVLRKVPIVGITSLGLDHTSILGNTLAEIAAAKAGIMKPNCEAYTVNQSPEAMRVLEKVATDVKCSLKIVPEYNSYSFQNGLRHDIALEAYQMNASLAVQLAHAWMRVARENKTNHRQETNGNEIINGNSNTDLNKATSIDNGLVQTLTKETVIGLRDCKWPGRFHVIHTDSADFYLDGAHTKESIEICAEWFEQNNRCRDKVLIFSATGDRDAEVLLSPLQKINFRAVYFVIPTAYKYTSKQNDNFSILENDELLQRCKNHANIWKKNYNNTTTHIMECVSEVIMHLDTENCDISVLITGSLHLVGASLAIIDPNLCLI